MPKEVKRSGRFATHIPGFDPLCNGGFVDGSVNLVTGGTGTGKTIFCLQFLHNAIDRGKKGLYVSFEENLEALIGDAREFGWDFAKLQKEGKCWFITFQPVTGPGLQAEFVHLIQEKQINVLVVDSISVLAMMYEFNYFKMRKELYILSDTLKKLGVTTLYTAEIEGEAPLDISGGGKLSRDGIVEFIADSVITVHNAGIGGESDRAIRILKMRRTKHEKGPVPLKISEKGMEVLKPTKF
jgi:circadian clock protein KaiC